MRPAGADALTLELAGERRELWLDAGPGTAGIYFLTRAERREMPVDEEPGGGRARQAFLHFRKRLGGARLLSLERVAGERALRLRAGLATVALRLWGPAPALTLVIDGAPRASIGPGSPAWPLPPAAPEREWTALDDSRIAAAMAEAAPARAILAACPGLGPLLARALAEGRVSWGELAQRLAEPRPTLLLPGPAESLHDADLSASGVVELLPAALPGLEGTLLRPPSWREAAASFLAARRRGGRFRARRAAVVEEARREVRRLQALDEHLARDLAGLPPPDELRRQAEALLASAAPVVAETMEVADPYETQRSVRVRIDPRLSLPANADRLFDKARRLERARRQVEVRRVQTRQALEASRDRHTRAESARDLADLDAVARPPSEARPREDPRGAGGARHYLTGGGLSVLVGRGARENHRLTFAVAGPEDFWLHARDVPGAHVVLRDPEGRARAQDLREAAELAAFFSDARSQPQVDVHVTRRKHVRAARGGHGRVRIAHSDTLRVTPRDPEGRLRRRL